ncbi:MAG: universal stress protein [Desulfobacterales bacterium]
MKKHILVAFDDSENAKRAVNYLAEILNPDSHVTLLSIMLDTEALCNMNSPELTPYFKSQQSSFCVLEDKKKELLQNALDQAKTALVDAGFKASNIRIKLNPKKHGIARDILIEAQSGYDLLVMGRRGLSGIKDFFLGGVSQKVFSHAKDISVLIVN